jgi:hypothetical protein
LAWTAAVSGVALANNYEPSLPPAPGCSNCPKIDVTPADGLVNGQTVQVTGIAFGLDSSLPNPDGVTFRGGTGGLLRECTANLSLCDSATMSFTTGRNGNINPLDHPATPDEPNTVPVPFTVKQTFSAGGSTVDCVQTPCVIYATRQSTDVPYELKEAAHHLSFLPVGRYTPLTPARILDTRDGTGGLGGPVGPGATVDVQITGRGGVPASGVAAVAMNVTVTQPSASGFLTIYPAGTARPLAANLNFTPNKTVPNLVVVKVGAGGRVSMFNSAGTTHVIYDVAGWYSDQPLGPDGRYNPLVPARILDTRDGTGGGARLGQGQSLNLQVAGRGGVPASGVQAAVLNVAVTGTTGASFLTVYPTGEARPLAANLNWVPGDTVSNRVMAKLGSGGMVTIFNNVGATDVVVDVGGWYTDASQTGTAGGTYTAVPPSRLLDTRDGTGGFSGFLGGGGTIDVQITGRGGVPTQGVSAVILNATVTQPQGPGFLTIFPAGAARPLASDLNYAPGEDRPNLVVVQVSPQLRTGPGGSCPPPNGCAKPDPYNVAGGKVSLFSSVTTHVVFDVAGWFTTVAPDPLPDA